MRTELVTAETSQLGEEPDIGMLLDPDVQRYEASLRALLGAVEAMEDAAPDRPDTGQSGPV